jgi:hypothetical protein
MYEWEIAAQKKDPKLDYHEYIKSPEWKYKSDNAKIKADFRCELCGVSGFARTLHTHHNTYERLGKELDRDLTVLCEDCHSYFHKGGNPGQRERLSAEEISLILKNHGITYTNNDPYGFYELGKAIIQHIIDGWDTELYDFYNNVNIYILDEALDNERRSNYQKAKDSDDWQGCGSEYEWRDSNEYWDGWKQ